MIYFNYLDSIIIKVVVGGFLYKLNFGYYDAKRRDVWPVYACVPQNVHGSLALMCSRRQKHVNRSIVDALLLYLIAIDDYC